MMTTSFRRKNTTATKLPDPQQSKTFYVRQGSNFSKRPSNNFSVQDENNEPLSASFVRQNKHALSPTP